MALGSVRPLLQGSSWDERAMGHRGMAEASQVEAVDKSWGLWYEFQPWASTRYFVEVFDYWIQKISDLSYFQDIISSILSGRKIAKMDPLKQSLTSTLCLFIFLNLCPNNISLWKSRKYLKQVFGFFFFFVGDGGGWREPQADFMCPSRLIPTDLFNKKQ